MNEQALVALAVAVVSFVSALIATYVSMQNRALLADVRRQMAELENRIVNRISGSYVTATECDLRHNTRGSRGVRRLRPASDAG